MQYDKADQQNCPRRVVFYGRVSTELEAQISAQMCIRDRCMGEEHQHDAQENERDER